MSQYCRFKFLSMVCCLTLQCGIKVLKITKYILCYQDQDKKVVTGHFSLANSGLHWLQNIICWWTVAVGMMSGCNVWNVLSNLVTTGPSSYFTGMRTVLQFVNYSGFQVLVDAKKVSNSKTKIDVHPKMASQTEIFLSSLHNVTDR